MVHTQMDQTFQKCVNSRAQSTRNFHSTTVVMMVVTVSEWVSPKPQMPKCRLTASVAWLGSRVSSHVVLFHYMVIHN